MQPMLESPAASLESLPQRGRIDQVDAGRVRVRLGAGPSVWAEPAVSCPLEVGREALVTRDAEHAWYVIGALGDAMHSGATARMVGAGEEERLQILSPTRELVCEYLPASGRLRIVAAGDLELAAPQGALRLSARQLDLAASQQVRLAVPGANVGTGTLVELDGRQVRAASERLTVNARECTADLAQARITGESLEVQTGRLRLAADALETLARVSVETVGDVYRTVRGLCEQQFHRWRTTVSASCYVKAEQMTLKTEQDFKVQGESIQLG